MPEGPKPAEFGTIRGFLWPIHRHELKKLVPMLLIFFFISLVYSLLRNTKDALIVTAPGGGAGLIPFLKAYGTIPGSILVMLAYARLSRSFGKRAVFRLFIGSFLLFFLAFAALYPVRDALEPVEWAARHRPGLSPWVDHLAALARHWVLALFYVMAELWGSVALSLLFWGFANDITRVEESKRFYGLFGVGANLALMAVSLANQVIHLAGNAYARIFHLDPWTAYVQALVAVVVLCGLAILAIYGWMHAHVLTDPRFSASVDPEAFRGPRPAMKLGEGLRFLFRSAYLRYVAILVLGYGITINLFEVTWKNQLGILHPDPSGYQDYMAGFSLATGAATVFLMLFISSNVLRRLGWTVAALVTPVALLVTGAGFFGFILFGGALASWMAGLRTTPNAVAVHLGAALNVMSKASKYSLFDPTKEMAYIPLDQESKVKGKAAIDVVGARLGKAGGSLILQALLGAFGSFPAITAPTAAISLGTVGIWIWAARKLGKAFRAVMRREGREGLGGAPVAAGRG